jgi:hypothetical protein
MVRGVLPLNIEIDVAPDDADKRDYNVVFDKAKRVLGFEAKTGVLDGVLEIYTALKLGKVDTGDKTITVKWYKNILEAKTLIESIYLNDRVI